MKKIFLLFLLSVSFILAQKTSYSNPTATTAVKFNKTPELRTMRIIEPGSVTRAEEAREIPNINTIKNYNSNKSNPNLPGKDVALQDKMGTLTQASPIKNWEGISFSTGGAGWPPDTQGDVGLNHYIQMVNSSFQIWDKSGNSLYGPVDNSTLWDGFGDPWDGTNDGDPIILYDEEADRWMLSQFSLPNYPNGPFYILIAVSETGDPLGSYYRYGFSFVDMPDYPKFGVWNDGYYMSVNSFSSGSLDYAGVGVAVFERDKMLVGDATASMQFFPLDNLANDDPWSMLPSEFDGPPPPNGTPNYFAYMLDNAWGVPSDNIRIWEFHTDWATPANSTFSQVVAFNTLSFDSNLGGISQPITTRKLDALSQRLMYRLQYRNFGDHTAMVTSQSVDVNGLDHAGVRWYEFRNSGSGWSIYQQGTYAPDTENRWMPSIAMDGYGNIGLGYSVSSSATFPSIRYTGRHKDDPLGQMTIAEQSIIVGTGYQMSYSRWGDYSMMSIDPADDATFWYSTEYMQTVGNNWQTRIASFSLGADLSVKIILEGAFVDEIMSNNLNSSGNLPRRQPYTDSYSGAEKISTVDDPVNNIEDFYEDNPDIVDWVLVSLRTGTDASTEVQKRAGFVKADGTVVGLDGSSPLRFGVPDDSYYVVVEHRNHLSVMSASAVAMSNASITSFALPN